MPTFAAQTLADAGTTVIPQEPTTLSLLLVGAGTLAVYAALSGRWRRAATLPVAASPAGTHESDESTEPIRRAA
jgi:hypothetical protein